jgi:DNA invertase Pin-like site-specific DNA recombinase
MATQTMYDVMELSSGKMIQTTLPAPGLESICAQYSRQSTDDPKQASLDMQLQTCRDKAMKDGFSHMVCFQARMSAWREKSIAKNVQFNKMNQLIKNSSIAYLYVYDVSRFMRNFMEASTVLKTCFKTCGIKSVMDGREYTSGSGIQETRLREEFFTSLLDAYKFSNTLSCKIKTTLDTFRKHGVHVGPAPYGYRAKRDNPLVSMSKKLHFDVANEIEIVAVIKKMFELGYTPSNISKYLNSTEIKNRKSLWNSTSVLKVAKYEYPSLPAFGDESKYAFLLEEGKNFIANTNTEQKDFWVQCDSCKKWRRIDSELHVLLQGNVSFSCSDGHMGKYFNCSVIIPEDEKESSTQEFRSVMEDGEQDSMSTVVGSMKL